MESGTVIVLTDVGLNVHAPMFDIPILLGVDLLPLQSLQDTLATGVVLWVRWPTYTRDHWVLLTHLHVPT